MRSALPPFAALETFLAVARTGVTLTVGPVVASLGLTPFVAELEDDHPGLVLHLVTTTRLLDLNAMGIDLALRYERRPAAEDDPLSFPEYAFPVCTPDLALNGAEQTLAHRRLLNGSHPDDWQRWAITANRRLAPAAKEMQLDTSEMVMNAALRGMGTTVGRTPLVNDALVSGQLVAPFGTSALGEGSYRIVASSRRPDDAVQAVIRWLGKLLGRP